MVATTAGTIEASSLERLTLAIRQAFAAIENMYPGVLRYKDVPLRGALERRVYQEALLDRGRLAALAQTSGDPGAFAEWLPPRQSGAVLSDSWECVKAYLRLIGAAFQRPAQQGSGPGPEIVFHVLRPRFIDFFLHQLEAVVPVVAEILRRFELTRGIQSTKSQQGPVF